MTQPTCVDKTFDTSLVDVSGLAGDDGTDKRTTGADVAAPSSSSRCGRDAKPAPVKSPETKENNKAPVQHLPTQTTYDAWAAVYDSDGNMLQAIDDAEMEELLPRFLGLVQSSVLEEQGGGGGGGGGKEVRVLDVGCGTGRNTRKVLEYAWEKKKGMCGDSKVAVEVEVIGADFSLGMMEVARRNLASFLGPCPCPYPCPSTSSSPSPSTPSTAVEDKARKTVRLRLEHCDCFPTTTTTTTTTSPPSQSQPGFRLTSLPPSHALLTTLVLEHIPLPLFFTTLASLLLPRGLALVTNMHADMGSRNSCAGFVNSAGVKIRGTSFVYTTDEIVAEAGKAGFEVLEVREREVRERDLESGGVGGRGEKWVGVRVWVGVVGRKV